MHLLLPFRCWFRWSVVPISVAFLCMTALASDLGSLHDDLSEHFLPASARAEGDGTLSLPELSTAMFANPAALGVGSSGWKFQLTRVSHRDVYFQTLNDEGKYADRLRYERDAVSIETLSHARPLGSHVGIGFALGFQHEGPFQRVDSEGHQVNRFPQTLGLLGLGVGMHLSSGLRLGVAGYRVRAKRLWEQEPHLGWGYLFHVGLMQSVGEHVTIGFVARNLTRGVSLPPEFPRRIDPELHLGIGVASLARGKLDLALGWHFPAHTGMRFGMGAAFTPRPWIQLHLGYVRDPLMRQIEVVDMDSGTTLDLEREWRREGLTFGASLRWNSWEFTASLAPQAYPRTEDDERLRLAARTSQQIAFAISRSK